MQKRIDESETRQFKVIFPNTLNNNNTLFGGLAMQWMDEVAYITATRFTRKKMVTVTSDKVHFLSPVNTNTIIEIIGKVINVGRLKIDVKVEIFIEGMYDCTRQKAVDARFSFAEVDKENNPVMKDLECYSD